MLLLKLYRFSLAFLDIGDVDGNTSYVRGNSIHDGFSTAIGVFGTNSLAIENNVIHRTVGASIQVTGKNNRLIDNLVVYLISSHTYKGRHEKYALKWPGAIEVHEATNVTLQGNAIGGSERIGFRIDGEECTDVNTPNSWTGNVVHGSWQGIHIRYFQGIPQCTKISGFLTWKNYFYGIFVYPEPRIIIENVMAIDNTVGMLLNVWGPAAVSHKTADKFFKVRHTLVVGTSPSHDCSDEAKIPYALEPYKDNLVVKKAPNGKSDYRGFVVIPEKPCCSFLI